MTLAEVLAEIKRNPYDADQFVLEWVAYEAPTLEEAKTAAEAVLDAHDS